MPSRTRGKFGCKGGFTLGLQRVREDIVAALLGPSQPLRTFGIDAKLALPDRSRSEPNVVMQFWNRLTRLTVTGSIAASALAATSADAERWRDLPFRKGATYRIDLDSLQWDGRIVKYRVEIIFPQNGLPHRVFSTGLINCETGQRKSLELEYPLADGSTRKEPRVDRWRTIEPWWGAESSRRFLCVKEEEKGG